MTSSSSPSSDSHPRPGLASEPTPLGLSSRYSVVRSLVGTPPCPIFGIILAPPSSVSSSPSLLLAQTLSALHTISDEFSTLFAQIIIAPASPTPSVALAAQLDLSHGVLLLDEESIDVDQALSTIMRRTSIDLDQVGGPLWRVWLSTRCCGSEEDEILLSFTGHHAVFDGLAVAAVACALGEAFLSLSTPSVADWILRLPSPAPPLPPQLETVVSVSPSLPTLLKALLPSYLTSLFSYPPSSKPWTGSPLASPAPLPRPFQYRTLFLSPSTSASLHVFCRENAISYTNLVHASLCLALAPLAGSLPLATGTPLSLRPLIPPVLAPDHDQGNYNGTLALLVYPSRSALLDVARAHRVLLTAPLARQTSARAWGMLAYLPAGTWPAYFAEKIAEGRKESSVELSALGRVRLQEGKGMRRAVFARRPQAMGAAVEVSVVNGTVGVGWEEGVLSVQEGDRLMERLTSGFEELARGVQQGEKGGD